MKTATMASLALFSCTAFALSGVSQADESIPAVSQNVPLNLKGDEGGKSSLQNGASAVVFAEPKEVVQQLPMKPANLPALPNGPSHPSLAALVSATDVTGPLDTETQCLATAIFYESRSESLEGQLAVARVIINRAHSPRFADSLCAVIKQPYQFSFVRNGRLPAPKTRRPAWKTAVAIARIAQQNGWESQAEGALFFHAKYVSPSWRRTRMAVIDKHIFYR